ncbi:hypothetical protein FOPE_04884 [Fonsecaea pedrosoi]|nr:hypothetical protein FOPE_04884 [Fonsecaea pedrosoi]
MSKTTTIELTPPASALLTPQPPIAHNDDDYDDGILSERIPETSPGQPVLRKGSTAVIFVSVTGVTGISSLLAGLVTVTLPTLAKDLHLPDSVLLWYSPVHRIPCEV